MSLIALGSACTVNDDVYRNPLVAVSSEDDAAEGREDVGVASESTTSLSSITGSATSDATLDGDTPATTTEADLTGDEGDDDSTTGIPQSLCPQALPLSNVEATILDAAITASGAWILSAEGQTKQLHRIDENGTTHPPILLSSNDTVTDLALVRTGARLNVSFESTVNGTEGVHLIDIEQAPFVPSLDNRIVVRSNIASPRAVFFDRAPSLVTVFNSGGGLVGVSQSTTPPGATQLTEQSRPVLANAGPEQLIVQGDEFLVLARTADALELVGFEFLDTDGDGDLEYLRPYSLGGPRASLEGRIIQNGPEVLLLELLEAADQLQVSTVELVSGAERITDPRLIIDSMGDCDTLSVTLAPNNAVVATMVCDSFPNRRLEALELPPLGAEPRRLVARTGSIGSQISFSFDDRAWVVWSESGDNPGLFASTLCFDLPPAQ